MNDIDPEKEAQDSKELIDEIKGLIAVAVICLISASIVSFFMILFIEIVKWLKNGIWNTYVIVDFIQPINIETNWIGINRIVDTLLTKTPLFASLSGILFSLSVLLYVLFKLFPENQ